MAAPAPMHMSKGGKLLFGTAAVGVGVALYFLFKRRVLVGSSPSEWELPSFIPRGMVEVRPVPRGGSLNITDPDAVDYSVSPEEQAATEAALKEFSGWRG